MTNGGKESNKELNDYLTNNNEDLKSLITSWR